MGKSLSKLILRNVTTVLLMGGGFLCTSCYYDKHVSADDPFMSIYSSAPVVYGGSSSVRGGGDGGGITLSCVDMPLVDLLRVLSDDFNCGIVYSTGYSGARVTAEFKKAALLDVLNVVARQLSTELVQVGNTYYLGKLRPEDKGILVRRVHGFSDSALSQIVTPLLSSNGRSSVFDSVVVVADHELVLSRIAESLDYLSDVQFDVWIVQFCFVTLRSDALAEGGAGVTTSGTLSYDVANNTLDLKDFNIDAVFRSSLSSSMADVYSSPMFLLRDGTTSKWQDGKRVPIPKRSVSDYGTVTTTGYDYVNTGFNVSCTVSTINNGARLSVVCEISDILSYVESAPLTSTTNYSFEVDVAENQLYLLGELQTYKSLDSQQSFLDFSGERGKSTVQLWCQCYRVAPGVCKPFSFPVD